MREEWDEREEQTQSSKKKEKKQVFALARLHTPEDLAPCWRGRRAQQSVDIDDGHAHSQLCGPQRP
jgi:hypothetical protein